MFNKNFKKNILGFLIIFLSFSSFNIFTMKKQDPKLAQEKSTLFDIVKKFEDKKYTESLSDTDIFTMAKTIEKFEKIPLGGMNHMVGLYLAQVIKPKLDTLSRMREAFLRVLENKDKGLSLTFREDFSVAKEELEMSAFNDILENFGEYIDSKSSFKTIIETLSNLKTLEKIWDITNSAQIIKSLSESKFFNSTKGASELIEKLINLTIKKAENQAYKFPEKQNLETLREILENLDMPNKTNDLIRKIGAKIEKISKTESEKSDLIEARKRISESFRMNTNKEISNLFEAIKNKKLVEIEKAVKKIDAKGLSEADSNGKTPLFYACLKQNPNIVKLLLMYGAAVDKESHILANNTNYPNKTKIVKYLELAIQYDNTSEREKFIEKTKQTEDKDAYDLIKGRSIFIKPTGKSVEIS